MPKRVTKLFDARHVTPSGYPKEMAALRRAPTWTERSAGSSPLAARLRRAPIYKAKNPHPANVSYMAGFRGLTTREAQMRRDGPDRQIIWVSGEPWGQDGGTHRAMATAISSYARILWVEPPRPPSTRTSNSGSVRPILAEATDNIVCLRPAVFPGFTRPFIRTSTPLLIRAQIRWAIRKLGFRPEAVVMLYLGGLLGGWGSDVTNVMYGTDDYVAGAALMRMSARHLRRRERQALSRADVTVAVSSHLARRWAGLGARPVVIPNGCWPLSDGRGGPQAKSVGLPSPVVGLIGRLSDRIDMDALMTIADSGQSLLLMGPRDPRWEPERFRELTSKPSVRYIGPVSSADVPAYLAAVDVGIIPYRDTELNRASFPLKTLEYLSAGLPVVASSLPAARWLRADLEEVEGRDIADRILVLADDGTDYLNAIRMITAENSEIASRRVAFASRHSWANRAEHFASATGLLPAAG
jgi:teichuronic acid biosynthesis glycosyltransferase TuaH